MRNTSSAADNSALDDPSFVGPMTVDPTTVDSTTVGQILPRREARRLEALAAAQVSRRAARVTVASTPGPSRSSRPVTGPSCTTSSLRHRMLQRFASVGAMAGVALIVVSTTVPANAFTHVDGSSVSAAAVASAPSTTATAEPQELQVDAIAAPDLTRDSYSVLAIVQQVQVESGNQVYSFSNDPDGAVQWPFPAGSPIASGFGPRQVAGCGFCSTYHQGLDFTPGSGTEIQAMAAGVVTLVENSSSGLGSHVAVDHVINGQKVQSVYAHMQLGSIRVAVGDVVAPGQVLGQVGSTGASTGAHLHMEIHLDGTPVDPFAWLQANAN